MLGDSNIVAIVPTHDLSVSRGFYQNTLGLRVLAEFEEGAVGLESNQGSRLLLYTTQVQVPAEHTTVSFATDDVERKVAELESRGVVFEEYDLSEYGFDAVATSKILTLPDGTKAAFFKDPEGNVLALAQNRWP